MSLPLNESLKNSYLEVLKFRSLVKEERGPEKDPWDFVNYQTLVANCLKILEPHVEKALPVKLLEEAYRIQLNPRFFYQEKVVAYSYTTRHHALKLTELFEKTCIEPSRDHLENLSIWWFTLAKQIDSDYQIAKNYFSP